MTSCATLTLLPATSGQLGYGGHTRAASVTGEAAVAAWMVSYELARRLDLDADRAQACADDACASTLDDDDRCSSVEWQAEE